MDDKFPLTPPPSSTSLTALEISNPSTSQTISISIRNGKKTIYQRLIDEQAIAKFLGILIIKN